MEKNNSTSNSNANAEIFGKTVAKNILKIAVGVILIAAGGRVGRDGLGGLKGGNSAA